MKNLLGRLMSRPFAELKVIAATWGTITKDPDPTQNELAIAVFHTMVDRSAMRGVWENLDPEARAFIDWLLHQRNMLAIVDDLPAHLERPADEVAPLIERVRCIGLVDVDGVMVRGSRVVSSGDNLYAWATKSQVEAVRRKVVSIAVEATRVVVSVMEESKKSPPFEESFAALLESLEADEIQRIANTWRLPDPHRYYKAELIGVMSEFVATAQGRNHLLTGLPPTSQGLYTYLEENSGKVTAIGARNHFGWDEREFRSALIPLTQRALVWDVLSAERRSLFIPFDVLKPAQSTALSARSSAMQPKLDAPDPHAIESRLPYEMPWDLLTGLGEAAREEIHLTLQDKRITKRLAKKVNDHFLHPTDIKAGTDYIDMVVHMAVLLGLLAERGTEQPAYFLTPKSEEWAKLSFEAQRRRLFGLWQEDRKWAEPATQGTIYWWNCDMTGARKRLVAHLTELPVGKWISVDGFLRKIQSTEPFLIWSQDELVKRFGLRALQGFRSHWFEIEGRIIADMLKNMLLWLGAIDLGRDKQKRFVAFRVTEEAQALFENGETGGRNGAEMKGSELISNSKRPFALRTPHSAPDKSLLVQPNFEALVLHPESYVVWNLIRMADLVRHDRVSVYVLNKESIIRAIEGGMSSDRLVNFLEENTGKELPQNVEHTVRDWARLIKRLEIERATLIKVDEAEILDELMASRKTRRYVIQRLSPTMALANLPEVGEGSRDDPWHKLVKELRAAGYIPHYEGENGGNGSHEQGAAGNTHLTLETHSGASLQAMPTKKPTATRKATVEGAEQAITPVRAKKSVAKEPTQRPTQAPQTEYPPKTGTGSR